MGGNKERISLLFCEIDRVYYRDPSPAAGHSDHSILSNPMLRMNEPYKLKHEALWSLKASFREGDKLRGMGST